MIHQERLVPFGEVRQYLWDGDLPAELVADSEAFAAFLDGRLMPRLHREKLIKKTVRNNLVTNLGAQQFASRIATGTAQPSHIAIGSAVITPLKTWVLADWTANATEFFRKACSIIAVYQSYYLRYVMNSATTDWNGTARASGLFDASGANTGNPFAIVSENTVKSSSNSLTTEWRIQVVN